MKDNREGRYLLSLLKNNGSQSRWYEPLIVVGIIGALAAIALPSFFAMQRKTKQAEARNQVALFNRAQQAHFLKKGSFANSLEQLNLRIKPEGKWYRYKMWSASENGPFQLRNGKVFPPNIGQSASFTAQPKEPNLKSYAGAVFFIEPPLGEKNLVVAICETTEASPKPPDLPIFDEQSGQTICADGSIPIN